MTSNRFLDLAGMKFGRLHVISDQPVDRVGPQKQARWLCRCECGAELLVRGYHLRSGNTQSCGCFQRDRCSDAHRLHGQTQAPTYQSWAAMRRRCLTPTSKSYSDYGGRGISICREWDDFAVFLRDMGERPSGKTLDRVDNDRGYSPDNCRWATPAEQKRNARGVVNVTIGPLTMCLQDWGTESGKCPKAIKRALLRGENPAQAVYG